MNEEQNDICRKAIREIKTLLVFNQKYDLATQARDLERILEKRKSNNTISDIDNKNYKEIDYWYDSFNKFAKKINLSLGESLKLEINNIMSNMKADRRMLILNELLD